MVLADVEAAMKSKALWLAFGLFLGAGGSALAGYPEGRFKALLELEWESDCTKPSWPMLSYADEYAVESAKRTYERYLRCVADAAENDAAYAAEKVAEDAQEEVEDVQRRGRSAGWTFR